MSCALFVKPPVPSMVPVPEMKPLFTTGPLPARVPPAEGQRTLIVEPGAVDRERLCSEEHRGRVGQPGRRR